MDSKAGFQQDLEVEKEKTEKSSSEPNDTGERAGSQIEPLVKSITLKELLDGAKGIGDPSRWYVGLYRAKV